MSPAGAGGGRGPGSPGALSSPSSNRRERHAGGSGGAAPGPRLVLGTPNTVTNLHVAAPSGPEAAECLVCSELALLVLFSPCQHRTVCEGECGCVCVCGGGGVPEPTRARPAALPSPRRMCAQNEEVHQVPGGHRQEAAPRWVARPGPASARTSRPHGRGHASTRGPASPHPSPRSWPADGTEVASATPAPGPPRQLVEELQSRYRQMEERITCPICIDSHIRLVFQCGHGACAPCGAALSACPICRQPIRDRIQIFV